MRAAVLKALIVVAAVFAPAGPMLATALALTLVDMVTGILAARKRGEAITSAGLRRSISKLLLWEAAICLAFLVQTYMTGPAVPAASIVSGMIGMTELLSCLENLNELGDNKLLSAIITKLGSKNQ